MKKIILALMTASALSTAMAQTASDLFTSNDIKVSWLGLDFSHAKFIGSFSQIQDAGELTPSDIKNKYFPGWNQLIIKEQKKYDIAAMLRKENIFYDIDMITDVNSKTPLEDIEANTTPNYTMEDIKKIVRTYPLEGKSGIGIAFIIESFNKGTEKAIIYFVAINMLTKEVLIYEKFNTQPVGIGIRNYWAGAIYDVIKQINKTYYNNWKSQYKK